MTKLKRYKKKDDVEAIDEINFHLCYNLIIHLLVKQGDRFMLKVSENVYTNVCIDNVSKEIGNINLIDNMNLVVENGKCVGIKCSEEVGLTLFKMIYGIIPPSKGTLSIDGIKVHKHNTKLNTVISSILKDEGLYERLTINEYIIIYSWDILVIRHMKKNNKSKMLGYFFEYA
jgi:ABC-type uncharacterized transport system ATPase subunit